MSPLPVHFLRDALLALFFNEFFQYSTLFQSGFSLKRIIQNP